MDFQNIQKQISVLKESLTALEQNSEHEIGLAVGVVEFNKNADELKKKLTNLKGESDFFKSVFNTEDYYENISTYLEQIKRSLNYKIEKNGVSFKANENLQESYVAILNIIEILVAEYQIQNKNKAKNLFSRTIDTTQIKSILVELNTLQERIHNVLHIHSRIVSNVILQNFKIIYTFFYNCIKAAKQRKDELLLVEIAGITDKIITMIKPVFSAKILNTNELIYHYLIFELKELKACAIGEELV
ncbi:imidazole glycerol phosphate synthase [Campylobacter concisus]|uniref:imidazole glycerol phosphate synthase n=1 Tax=Campylobacter concisus TaxID=199 RepID=UPI000D3282A9|nr:imidazole glycerol phosphate synthase [Campylobacter concisus]